MAVLVSTQLAAYHQANLQSYQRLVAATTTTSLFWDIVVVTACDESQTEVYRQQIEQKQRQRAIPSTEYLVLSDPPGPKVGNGGSTLLVLQHLEQTYGAERLDKSRVLIIHAGGFSKRLPHVSAIGKIFCALPLGPPLLQMLELKLIMYVHLPQRMIPGVFVTCADDIELFDSQDNHCRFDQVGFTALAHPSSLAIGETHGVFCLDQSSQQACSNDMQTDVQSRRVVQAKAQRFLHKPKTSLMNQAGAVIQGCLDGEYVYTDSAYYFDRSTSLRLLQMYNEVQPIKCEIDAYGDFLQALGNQADSSYTQNTANVVAVEEGLVAVRQTLFNQLRGTPLHVLIFNNSKFYHIGTTDEYLFHFCQDAAFKRELSCSNFVDVHCRHLNRPIQILQEKDTESAGVVVLGSVFDHSSTVTIQNPTVVEYCRIEEHVTIGSRCIISNAHLPAHVFVPSDTFLYVLETTNGRYLPIVFGISEDLKRKYKSLDDAKIYTVSLHLALTSIYQDAKVENVWAEHKEQTLWEARIFPSFQSRKEATLFAVDVAQTLTKLSKSSEAVLGKWTWPDQPASVADALLIKDVAQGLKERLELSFVETS